MSSVSTSGHRPSRVPRALLLALVACAGAAQAARPLQTDDAGVLDPGACEAQGYAARLTADGQRTSDIGLEFACGWGWHSQLAVSALRSRLDDSSARGLALAGKTGLWKAEGQATALTLSWQLRAGQQPQDRWRHVGSGLNLLLSTPVAALGAMHLQLGHAMDPQDRRQSTIWGLAFEHAGLGQAGRWVPVAEIYGDDRDRPWWNTGLRYVALPDRLFFDASYGRRMAAEAETLVTLGVKASF